MGKVNIRISLFSIIACIVLHFLTYAPYGLFAHNMAIISSFFVFYNLFSFFIQKGMQHLFLAPFITMNWIYFESPYLLEKKTEYYLRIINEDYIDELSIYFCLAIAFIFFGYYFFYNRSVKPISPINLKFNLLVLKKLIFVFISLGVFYRLGEQYFNTLVLQLSNIIQVLFYAPTIVLALYILYLYRSKSFGWSKVHVLTISFLLFEFLLRLSTTLFASVIILFVGALIVIFREKRKISIIYILLISLVLFPIYEARKYFRFQQEVQSIGVSRGLNLAESLFGDKEKLDQELESSKKGEYNKEHNRFENLSFISQVVHLHRSGFKQFLYGETFYWLPIVPIPRIIFPGKPINEMSTKIATDYGLRGEDSVASINFPMLVEGYINFGLNGMLIMAFAFGMAYKWFIMKFGLGLGDLNLIIVINSFKQFMHAEGNITLVFGALIQVYIFWRIIVWYYKLNEIKTTPNVES